MTEHDQTVDVWAVWGHESPDEDYETWASTESYREAWEVEQRAEDEVRALSEDYAT
jgi:hypothetical protein